MPAASPLDQIVAQPAPEPQRELTQPELLNDYAIALRGQGKFLTALTAIRRALALDPESGKIWNNLGCVLINLARHDEAERALLKAQRLEPEVAERWGNMGVLYTAMRRYDEAQAMFDRAAELGDEQKKLSSAWDASLMHLERGDWARGFEGYEARVGLNPARYPKFPVRTWRGEDLGGKSLVVWAEQGLGDRLLFSRFVYEVHRRWPTCAIHMAVGERMENLLWEFRAFVNFMPAGAPWPEGLDYAVFMASLPGALGVTPGTVPLDPGLIRKRVDAALGEFSAPTTATPGSLRIGVAWTGNPAQIRNHERSIPLEAFLPLCEDPFLTLFSFQVGPGSEDIQRLGAGDLIYDFGPELAANGYVAAALAMLDMDVIVTACTGTAHLAGVLGVPCWVLLCHDPYWVWMQDGPRARRDSLFYPSVRLYRQRRPGDWAPVLAEVTRDLKALRETRRAA